MQVTYAKSVEQATTKKYFVQRPKKDEQGSSVQQFLNQELLKPLKRSASIMTENGALLNTESAECDICSKAAIVVPEQRHQK